MTLTILILVLLGLVVIFIIKGIVIVPQAFAYIVERLGKYHKTLFAGLHIINPLFDRIVYRISLREDVLDLEPQVVITKDNATITVDAVVFYKVFDPQKAAYAVTHLRKAIEQLTMTNLRAIMGKLTLDEGLSSRDKINAELGQILDEITDSWGTKVTRVEIKNIIPPVDIQEAMAKQMKAEREKRAKILEAEAIKESAQREAEARERLALAEANAIKYVVSAITEGGESAMYYFLGQKYIEALEKLANSQNSKYILIPADIIETIKGIVGKK